jgi:single-strand DNA-binding protein
MKGLNRAFFIGHLGHDPELRSSASGLALLKVSIATPASRKVNETWIDTPDWHRLTLFGQEAEFLGRYAKKGDSLAVECSIRPSRWTDKEGQTHHEVSLVVDRVLWLSSRARTGQEDALEQQHQAEIEAALDPRLHPQPEMDTHVPF